MPIQVPRKPRCETLCGSEDGCDQVRCIPSPANDQHVPCASMKPQPPLRHAATREDLGFRAQDSYMGFIIDDNNVQTIQFSWEPDKVYATLSSCFTFVWSVLRICFLPIPAEFPDPLHARIESFLRFKAPIASKHQNFPHAQQQCSLPHETES